MFFAWTGAPGETLRFTIRERVTTTEGKPGPIVVFQHGAGRTSEIHVTPCGEYFHLFAVAKNATCQNEDDKTRRSPNRAGLARSGTCRPPRCLVAP